MFSMTNEIKALLIALVVSNMADIFITEEYIEGGEEGCTESQSHSPQVEAVIKESEEPQKCLDNLHTVKEAESGSDMTLKQGEPDDQLDDGLLFKPGDLPLPVVMLEKYVNSDITFNRQKVVHNLLETLRLVQRNKDEVTRVINVLCTLSDDYDPIVRSELMGQFPYIAAFCNENGLNSTVQEYLLPILMSYLGAENNQVRKAAHSALLAIVEQKLIDAEMVTEKICRLVVHLTDSIHPEDFRTDSVQLMSKLAILVGEKVTEELFLQRFMALCVDKANYVRKACASTFGDICTTVGTETTEELLLPEFIELCKDKTWGVRKACAENFMAVSSVVSREIRCNELTDIYMVLLKDQSRWVRVTAYQGLGPFISTFAEPYKTGLYYNEGELVICDVQKLEDALLQMLGDKSPAVQNSENSSNVDRTNNFEPCDSIVPLGCSERPLSASKIPGIPCYVGNYSTVIDTSCPTVIASTAKENVTGNVISVPPMENGSHCLPQTHKKDTINWCENKSMVNHFNCTEDSVTKTPREIDYDRVYKKFSPELNGDCNELNITMTSKDSENIQNFCSKDAESETPSVGWYNRVCKKYSSEVTNDFNEGDTVNSKDSESIQNLYTEDSGTETSAGGWFNRICKKFSPEMNESFNELKEMVNSKASENTQNVISSQNSVTVNGVCITTSEVLSEPLNYQNIPVVNCVINKSKTIMQENENNSKEINNEFDNSERDDSFHVCVHTSGAVVNTPSSIMMGKKSGSTVSLDDESAFNHFQYWRTPIPEIDIDSLNSELSNSHETVNISRTSIQETYTRHTPRYRKLRCFERQFPSLEIKIQANDGASENKEGEPPPGQNNITAYDQDIVPPELLFCYLNMIDAAWTEIAHHCAYSLPAVAITLGRKFWPCLKETFDALSSDLQGFIMMWKVRRTVASSMHQLAVILGPEITSRDLLPVFSRFIKDLDEVRIGILQHLSEFLKELRPEERKQFLPSLSEFLVSNSDTESKEKNWRFRLILAKQLVSVADLYSPEDVKEHLVPLSLTLIQDKICEVRLAAVRVMAAVMKRMSQHPTPTLTKEVLSELTEKFIHSPKWFHRQLYVYICQEFIVQNSLPPDQFAEDALPQLLYLCWDRVPNVRIAIARCLAVIIWPLETFSSPDSPHRELLLQTIHTLQSDLDVDVQFYANMVSTLECSCLQHGEFTNLGQLPV